MSSRAEPVPGTYFPCLDAYRGIGMLMVLLSHASFSTGHTGSALGPYLSRFELAVPMFFVLSGFLLYRAEAFAVLTDRAGTPPRRFLRRRALRIFPAYWVALVGIVAVWGAAPLDGVGDWIANLFVLQQFGVDRPLRITQAWSIGVELSFYLLLPLYVAAVRRVLHRMRPADPVPVLVAGLVVLFAVGSGFRVLVVLTEPSWAARSLQWLPMYLDFFATGMALALVSARVRAGAPPPAPVRWAAEHPAGSWLGAAAIFVLVAQMDPPAEPFGLNGLEYLPRQAAYTVASALWLAPAMFGDQRVGRLRTALASRPFAWLGAISLSFYLWHLALIQQAKAWTVPDWDLRVDLAADPTNDLEALATFTGNFWLVSAIAIVTTLVVAGLVHRFVEVPFLFLKDRPLRQVPAAYRETLRRASPEPTRGAS